jgi:hypothetical protein
MLIGANWVFWFTIVVDDVPGVVCGVVDGFKKPLGKSAAVISPPGVLGPKLIFFSPYALT